MIDRYVHPELRLVCVDVEQGFAYSVNLDDMYETEGSWD